jgi:hypothetical protein
MPHRIVTISVPALVVERDRRTAAKNGPGAS